MDLEGWKIICAQIIQKAWTLYILRAFYKSIRSKSTSFHSLTGERLQLIRAAERCHWAIERVIGDVPTQKREAWKFHHIHYMTMSFRVEATCNLCAQLLYVGDLVHSCENLNCDWDICPGCHHIYGNDIPEHKEDY